MGAGGATTFNFQNGEVYGWKMDIQGSEERILDSVLPHEINHTIFACYFRRPLPRWADEGAASLIEHGSERLRLRKIHDQVMGTSRKIPLKTLLEMKNYPQDKQQVLTLYAEGHSLADFLIQKSDKPSYIKFLQVAHEEGWPTALQQYNYSSVDALERDWDKWVLAGNPALNAPAGTLLASNKQTSAKNEPMIRGQSPDATQESITPMALAEQTLPHAEAESQSNDDAEQAEPRADAVVITRPLSRDGLVFPLLTQPAPSGAARVPHDRLVPMLPVRGNTPTR